MLPFSTRDTTPRSTSRIVDQVKGWLKVIFANRNSRYPQWFLLLNFTFACFELIYGVWTNSLGSISHSLYIFCAYAGLLTGLAASVIRKWAANDKYSFGYLRAEVIASFANCLFLLFIPFFIISEAFERVIEPPEVKHEGLFHVSVLGFLVNLIGICASKHGHSHSNQSQSYSHNNNNGHYYHSLNDNHETSTNSHIMKFVLHIHAHILGSVGVVISSLLMQWFGWMQADLVCSLFIALLIAVSVFLLIKDSIYILMQRQPVALDNVLPRCYQKVMQLVGVYGIQEPHFWTLCSDYHVGGIKIEVSKEVDPMYIINQTQMIFSSVGIQNVYVHLDYVSS